MKKYQLLWLFDSGSRFGQGIKQFKLVGLNNEIIMDYSIHGRIKVGFSKINFKREKVF